MGEIAEMMLNGDMDEETGEWLGNGPGYPRSPSREARLRREMKRTQSKPLFAPDNLAISKKSLKWLTSAAAIGGALWDDAPGVFTRLEKRGLVKFEYPKVTASKKGGDLLAMLEGRS